MIHYKGANCSQSLEHLDVCRSWLGEASIEILPEELDNALIKLRCARKLDSNGVSLSAFRMMHRAQPDMMVHYINELVSSHAAISAQQIHGKVWGKECSQPRAGATRAILPLSVPLGLLDKIVSDRLNDWISRNISLPDSIYIGAAPKTQCLDVAFTAQQILEKGNDDNGRGVVAQGDVQQFYDNISIVRFANVARQRGMPMSLIASCVSISLFWTL